MMTTHQLKRENAGKENLPFRSDSMSVGKDYDTPAKYQIRVKGILDPSWSDWFDGFTVASSEKETELTGLVPDQSALHGILTKLNDLGLTILSITQLKGGNDDQD
jgi:hypothetical protein